MSPEELHTVGPFPCPLFFQEPSNIQNSNISKRSKVVSEQYNAEGFWGKYDHEYSPTGSLMAVKGETTRVRLGLSCMVLWVVH